MKNFKLKPYQIDAAKFALTRTNSYLALKPGMGKTAIACKVIEYLLKKDATHKFVYVAQASLILNVYYEMQKWLPEEFHDSIRLLRNGRSTVFEIAQPNSIFIVNDYLLSYRNTKRTKENVWPYLIENLSQNKNITLIVDEAHRFNHSIAQRSRNLYASTKYFNRVCLMSGTPVRNRPIELFKPLSKLAPSLIDNMNYHQYGIKYCAGYKKKTYGGNFAWDFTGQSNLPELRKKIEPFMFKAPVKDIGVIKTHRLVYLNESDQSKNRRLKLDKEILARKTIDDLMSSSFTPDEKEFIARYRNEIGKRKVEASAKYIRDTFLSSNKENLIVFTYHRLTLSSIKHHLEKNNIDNVQVIEGSTPTADRQKIVDKFQKKDARPMILLANILSANQGFTLTKSNHVIFVETTWSPADILQAEDRIFRLSQTRDCLIEFLVFKDSLDEIVLKKAFNKEKTTELF